MSKLQKPITIDLNPQLDTVEKFYENINFIEPIQFLAVLEDISDMEWEPDPEEFLGKLAKSY